MPPTGRPVYTSRECGRMKPGPFGKFKIVLSERPVLRRLASCRCPALTALSDRVDVPACVLITMSLRLTWPSPLCDESAR